jgi:hypothetical protein
MGSASGPRREPAACGQKAGVVGLSWDSEKRGAVAVWVAVRVTRAVTVTEAVAVTVTVTEAVAVTGPVAATVTETVSPGPLTGTSHVAATCGRPV